MNDKERKDLERNRLINNHLADRRKQHRNDLKDKVTICPCCGQPTCTRNEAEQYFKKE